VSAREEQVRVFQSRQAELSALIQEQTNQSLQRQIAELEQQRAQGLLFDAEHNLERLSRTKEALTEELARRLAHGEELKLILDQERKRVLERVLPARHALRDRARLFPVAVEFRFPSESGR
jgi:hypothetical protein